MEFFGKVVDFFTKSEYIEKHVETQAAHRAQNAQMSSEIDSINEAHRSRVRYLEQSIRDSENALYESKRRHERERREKEEEIERDKKRNAEQLQRLEDDYRKSMVDAENQTEQRMRELEENHRKERAALMKQQQKDIDDKNEELEKMRKIQHNEIAKQEKEQRRIMKEREDELARHAEQVSDLRTRHNEQYNEQIGELHNTNMDNLEQQRKAIEDETIRRSEMSRNMLAAQVSVMNEGYQLHLANAITNLLEPLDDSTDACKQLKDAYEYLAKNANTGFSHVGKSNKEWAAANERVRKATTKIRTMLQNYTTIDPEFRMKLERVVNDIDQNMTENKDLPITVKQAVMMKKVTAIEAILPRIEQQIKALESIRLATGMIIAPHNPTLNQYLMSGNGGDRSSTEAIANGGI